MNSKPTNSRPKTLQTLHGGIELPAFLPDATYGAINSITFADAESAGVREIVTTTLHLELKLGADYIRDFGGLHKFFNWDRPILTDSGGFQVFSLIHRRGSKTNYLTEEGAHFKDYVNGKLHTLTPESSQEIQHKLGSDIRVVLDEPLAHGATAEMNLESVERTTAWAKRSKQKFLELNGLSEKDFENSSLSRPLLSGVVQGADDYKLRQRSRDELVEIGFDMYNFGGFPMLPDGTFDYELSQFLAEILPPDKIRYAMGVGTPDDMIKLAAMGWDLFDCVLPTRNARHGYLYVPLGEGDVDYENYSVLHLKSKRYEHSDVAIASQTHPALDNISRAYLRHLIRIHEPAGFRLATLHNLLFFAEVMRGIRNDRVKS